MTTDDLATLRGNIGTVQVRLESELERLQNVATTLRTEQLQGGREIAVAITNIETGLLWLREAARKI